MQLLRSSGSFAGIQGLRSETGSTRADATQKRNRSTCARRAIDSDAKDLDSQFLKWLNSFVGGAGAGDEHVNFACLADEGRGDLAELAGVDNGDHLTGLLDHFAVDEAFFGFKRGGAAVRVEARDADEDPIEINVFEEIESCAAGERKGPGPRNYSSGEHGADAGLVAQLHSDIDGVGNYVQFVAMAKAATDVGGGSSGGEADGFAGLHEFGGCQADAALFCGVALLPGEERTVVAEWFVEKRFDERCSTVSAPDEAAILEAGQVAADAGRGTACLGENFVDRGAAGAQKKLDDFFRTVAEGVSHKGRRVILPAGIWDRNGAEKCREACGNRSRM